MPTMIISAQKKSWWIFLSFSFAFYFLFTGKINPWLSPPWLVSLMGGLLIAGRMLLSSASGWVEGRSYRNMLLVYSAWIISSSLAYCTSLSLLGPLHPITVTHYNTEWGLHVTAQVATSYLLFPVLLFLAICLYHCEYSTYRSWHLLPILFVPSLVVAFYQAFVDIQFLNVPFFAERMRASGLGCDANSFGLTIYLLLPLCIYKILTLDERIRKLAYCFLCMLLFIALLISGSRTGLAGVIALIVLLPVVFAWVHTELPVAKRWLLVCSPVFLLIGILLLGLAVVKANRLLSLAALNRVDSSFEDFKEGGTLGIFEKSMRIHLWRQALRMIRESPVAGFGPGGYQRNLDNVRYRYAEDPGYTFVDNACNHYLQMAAELGIPGLTLNLVITVLPLWMLFCVRNRIENRDERWAVGIAFTSIIILLALFLTGSHTMALDVLWVFVLLLAFLYAAAIRYGYQFSRTMICILGLFCFLSTIVFAAGTYWMIFGKKGYQSTQNSLWWPLRYERNCYGLEQWNQGNVRWCGKDSHLQIPITLELQEEIKVLFWLNHPDVERNPVTVRYGGKSGVQHEITLAKSGWNSLEIPITRDYIYEHQPPGRPEIYRYLVLSLDVSRTWVPKEWGINADERKLGVAVLLPSL
jgi:O-antigen ligase